MNFCVKHKSIIITGILFAIVYASISLVNHYNFRTYALDLGLYTHAAYKYAHFKVADSTMIKSFQESMLGGHFDMYLVLLSPLIFLLGTYSLLFIQIIAILFGGLGIYTFFLHLDTSNKKTPLYAAILFYSFFGVFGAISFDYHSVVVASCLIPWFFVSIWRGTKIQSILILLFILIAQENVSLWLTFICLALVIEHRRNKKQVTFLLFLSGISLLYFSSVITWIIPFFSAHHAYSGFNYSSIGSNMFEAMQTIVMEPFRCAVILFTNHTKNPFGDFVKTELHVLLLTSGLPFLLKKPHFILMLLPIYFQKLFHDNYAMWGIGMHYSIEFAPILAIGIFMVLSELRSEKTREILSYIVLIFVIGSTFRTMDSTIFFTDKAKLRFYQKDHYQRIYDVKSIHHNLAKIPSDAIVSAQSPFVPHLALRESIYQFPLIKNAEYIVYSKKEKSYPLTQKEFDEEISKLENLTEWEIFYSGEVIILKKSSKK